MRICSVFIVGVRALTFCVEIEVEKMQKSMADFQFFIFRFEREREWKAKQKITRNLLDQIGKWTSHIYTHIGAIAFVCLMHPIRKKRKRKETTRKLSEWIREKWNDNETSKEFFGRFFFARLSVFRQSVVFFVPFSRFSKQFFSWWENVYFAIHAHQLILVFPCHFTQFNCPTIAHDFILCVTKPMCVYGNAIFREKISFISYQSESIFHARVLIHPICASLCCSLSLSLELRRFNDTHIVRIGNKW